MKIKSIGILLGAIIAVAANTLRAGPLDVVEQNHRPPPTDNQWSFRLAMYGWMQSLDGTIGIRGIESEVDVPFSDILEQLNFGAMGTIEVRYGRWAVAADM